MVVIPPRWLTFVGLGLALLGGRAPANRPPADAQAVLDKAESLQLLSLDPDEKAGPKARNHFHGYRVLGSTEVKGKADRQKLLAALSKGLADSDGTVARCFIPRHGIRASQGGKTVELVICFECLQVRGYLDGKRFDLSTTAGPQPAFDALLKAAKVKLPAAPGRE